MLDTILIIIALVCLGLEALKVQAPFLKWVSLGWAGLFFWALTLLV